MASSNDSRSSSDYYSNHYTHRYEQLAKESASWQGKANSFGFGGIFSFLFVFCFVLEGLRRAPATLMHHQAENMQELSHVYCACAMAWAAFTGLGAMGMVVGGGGGATSSTNYMKPLCFATGIVMGSFYLAKCLDLVHLPRGPDGAPVYLPRIVAWLFARSFLMSALWASSECPSRVLTQSLLLDWGSLTSRLVAGFTIGISRHSTVVAGLTFDFGLMYYTAVMFGSIVKASQGFPRAQNSVHRLQVIFMVSWSAFPVINLVDQAGIISRHQSEILMGLNEFVAFALCAEAMGHSILGVSSDREMTQMQKRSMELVVQLQDAEKRKDRIFATMSHELRTPLNGIIGLTESILHTEAESLTPKATGSLTTVLNTANRFGKLINTILDSASIKEKKLQLSLMPVSLHQVLKEAIGLTNPLVSSRVKLVSQIPENLPMLLADPNRLMQILYNILGNAAKFCTQGKITVRAMQVGFRSIHIEVEDTGIGIPADQLDKIFEPFEQVDNSTSRGYGGTGLGLNLALNLAKAHDGDLKVRSIPGQGTIFTIHLPILKDGEYGNFRGMDGPIEGINKGSPLDSKQDLQQDSDDAKNSTERDALQKRKSLKRTESRLKVLSWINNTKAEMLQPYMPGSRAADDDKIHCKQIELLSVDDDPLNQKVMEDILGDCSYRITTAMSGTEVLEILKERFERDGTSSFPDLIMMDFMMPGMTGLETTQIIRRKYPMAEMPIIMVTANDDEATVHKALTEGANDYIKKPVRRSELQARVKLQLQLIQYYAKEVESRKQRQILKAILPSSIIERLSAGQTRIADKHKQVTVLFADIVGFTTMATECSTPDIVHMLDSMFSSFDSLTDAHGVQKIETIGDCYMVATGHESESSMDGQASRMLKFAKEMLLAAAETQSPDGKPLMIRVGIHTGPAYAGVVGQKIPRYCLFGDTVNTASRMESTGFPGCIQISNSTHDVAMACPEIRSKMLFCDLGARPVKGKGEMQTWLLQEGPWEVALAANLQQMKNRSYVSPSSGNIDASCKIPGEVAALLSQKLEPIEEVSSSLASLNAKIETLLMLQQRGMAGSLDGISCAISQGEPAAGPAQQPSGQNDLGIVNHAVHGQIGAWLQRASGGDLQSSVSTPETRETCMSCQSSCIGSANADWETSSHTVCPPNNGNDLSSTPTSALAPLKAKGLARAENLFQRDNVSDGPRSTCSSGDMSMENNSYLNMQGGQMGSPDRGLSHTDPGIQKHNNQQDLPVADSSNRQAPSRSRTSTDPGFSTTSSARRDDSAYDIDLAARFGYPEPQSHEEWLRGNERHFVPKQGASPNQQRSPFSLAPLSVRGKSLKSSAPFRFGQTSTQQVPAHHGQEQCQVHASCRSAHELGTMSRRHTAAGLPRKSKSSRQLIQVFAKQMQASQETMFQLLSQEDHCNEYGEHGCDDTHFGLA